ncbi:MAG: DUF3416 domain-containing protein, partial [Proteobacteria bacterium]
MIPPGRIKYHDQFAFFTIVLRKNPDIFRNETSFHFSRHLRLNSRMEKSASSSSSSSTPVPYLIPEKNPSRVLIDRVQPSVDGGRFAAKRFIGEEVQIMAVLLVDGHDLPQGRALVRHESQPSEIQKMALVPQGNDEWVAHFTAKKLGKYWVRIEAAMDRFGTWRSDTLKKLAADQDVTLELRMGLELMQ